MKKIYFTLLALIISTMAFAQVIVNDGFETGNTVDATPVGWICNDNGWKAGITIPDDNVARGRKPHTGDWYMYASYNTDVWAYKEINATAGSYYRVSFWYSTWHVDHFNLEIKAGASATPSAMTITVIPDFIVDNEEFQQASAVFQATSSGSFYVGFHSVATNMPWYLSIDDVVIEQTAQYNFNIEQLTADTSVYFGESAYLRFLLSNTGEQQDTYQFTNTSSLPIEFYQDGSQVTQVSLDYNTSVELTAIVTLPMNLTNNETLHATFNVTSSHSAPTQSADYTITALEPIHTFPINEGFESETFPPTGWLNVATNGNYIFERKTSNDWPACTPHDESAGMARFYCYTSPAGSSCNLVSPKLQLNATDNVVRYWIYRNYNNNIMGPDRINVYYSPTTNTADGTLLGTVHRNTMLEPVVGDHSDWYEYNYTFNSPEGYGFIIIEAVSGYGWNLCIDDIYINATSVDNNPPTVVSLKDTQTWADTQMSPTLRIYDESGVPNQLQATYTIDGQSHDVTFVRSGKSNYDYTATLPAQPNHTTASIVFHLADDLGHTADSDPYELHWDWQAPILLEGFEDEQFPPAGWSIESLNMSWFSWYRFRAEYATNYFGDEYYVVPPQGERMAGVEWDESEEWGPQDESLVTPLLTINRPTALTFETFCQYGVAEYHDHYKVDVLNTNTGSWTTLWDAVDQPEWVNQFQEPVQLDLSPYQGQNIRLRFRAHNNGSDILTYSWFIDNVKVVATDTITPQGIGEIDLKTSIYPNPVDDLMTIRSDEDIQLVSVYNILGIKVKEVAVNQKETVIDLTQLSAGAYMIEIVAGEKKSIKTIIKK
ncbi:MAG: T9SS type A sorting domain-containing protein [Bacteroidales bacterium]|nr:T9SS type A sorting domain-containing protein [Bacteroidales bacterium]